MSNTERLDQLKTQLDELEKLMHESLGSEKAIRILDEIEAVQSDIRLEKLRISLGK